MATAGPVYAAVDRVISCHVFVAAFRSLRMFSSVRPVAGKMEEVSDQAVDGDEALALPCRLEPDHASFSSSNSQARILRPGIQALMRAMLDTGHDFSSGGIVGSEFVGDQDTRCDALALRCRPENVLSRCRCAQTRCLRR
jgi:hypothetical protein